MSLAENVGLVILVSTLCEMWVHGSLWRETSAENGLERWAISDELSTENEEMGHIHQGFCRYCFAGYQRFNWQRDINEGGSRRAKYELCGAGVWIRYYKFGFGFEDTIAAAETLILNCLKWGVPTTQLNWLANCEVLVYLQIPAPVKYNTHPGIDNPS